MKSPTKEELSDYLVAQWDYLPAQAPEYAQDLMNMAPEIMAAFETWMENGEFPDAPVFTSYSPRILRKLTRIKPPAIFMLLDWIRREPKEATQALRRELIKE